MQAAQDALSNVNFSVGGLTFAPQAWQVIAIVFLLFLLAITMASVRRHLLEWAVKGAGFGVVLGFILALIIEGFLILGGRTALTEILGWKNAPEPIQQALDQSRSKLVNVLGESTEVPKIEASEEKASVEGLLSTYRELTPDEANEFIDRICLPRER